MGPYIFILNPFSTHHVCVRDGTCNWPTDHVYIRDAYSENERTPETSVVDGSYPYVDQ